MIHCFLRAGVGTILLFNSRASCAICLNGGQAMLHSKAKCGDVGNSKWFFLRIRFWRGWLLCGREVNKVVVVFIWFLFLNLKKCRIEAWSELWSREIYHISHGWVSRFIWRFWPSKVRSIPYTCRSNGGSMRNEQVGAKPNKISVEISQVGKMGP